MEPNASASARTRNAETGRPVWRWNCSMEVNDPQRARAATIPFTGIHIHRTHLHAMLLRISYDLRGGIKTHRLAVKQRGREDGGVVALQPGRHIHQQRERCRVAFGKTVFAKSFDLLEALLGK